MSSIILVKGLVKRYGSLTAVDGVDLSVGTGQLYAFLGPNGAGKSTTVNILCTLLRKSAGEVEIDGLKLGRDDLEIRKRIGVVFQNNVLDELLTVRENLLIRGGLYGKSRKASQERMEQISDVLSLGDIMDRPVGKLSGGQKRRGEIARALMNEAKILFLDEPTTGLDPQTRLRVWEMVTRLQSEMNMTVFLTTHYMEEAAAADWVAIIDHGKIVAEGTPTHLKAEYSFDTLKIIPVDTNHTASFLQERQHSFSRKSDVFSIPLRDSLEGYALLKEMEGSFRSFELIQGSMDDVFVNITGRAIRED